MINNTSLISLATTLRKLKIKNKNCTKDLLGILLLLLSQLNNL